MTETVDNALSNEQKADEQSLLSMVDNESSTAGSGYAGQPQESAVTPEESLKGLLQLAGMMLGVAGLKHTAAVWNENNCNALAYAAVPVMQKYPWGQKAIEFLMTGAGVQEMALFAVLMPMTLATVQGYKADMAERAEKPAAEGAENVTQD